MLNADDAATLFEEYNQDREKYRVAVHPAATWIRDELFRRALKEKLPKERSRVLFTAGSNAAGKSTALSFTQEAIRAQAVFDSTFSNPAHARHLIDQALAAGKRITVLYVNRRLEETLLGMLERAGREGRVVTIDQMLNSHQGAVNSVRALWQEFGADTRVQFRFVENSEELPRLGTINWPQRWTTLK